MSHEMSNEINEIEQKLTTTSRTLSKFRRDRILPPTFRSSTEYELYLVKEQNECYVYMMMYSNDMLRECKKTIEEQSAAFVKLHEEVTDQRVRVTALEKIMSRGVSDDYKIEKIDIDGDGIEIDRSSSASESDKAES